MRRDQRVDYGAGLEGKVGGRQQQQQLWNRTSDWRFIIKFPELSLPPLQWINRSR